MSLKILAALVLLVLVGVVTSVHGYVLAEETMYPQAVCPQSDAANLPQGADRAPECSLDTCETEGTADAGSGIRRGSHRTALNLRRWDFGGIESFGEDSGRTASDQHEPRDS